MTYTSTDHDTETNDPPPPAPDIVGEFLEWMTDYCEVGDPATAAIHLRHLRAVLKELQAGLSVLETDVVKGFGRGRHEISGVGAFQVHRGAKRYIVAKPSDDDPVEYRRLLRDVIATVPEGEDPLPVFEEVWPMGPGHCRWTAVKKLGLDPKDYREADGWKHTVELL
jgi:hypothetical protein